MMPACAPGNRALLARIAVILLLLSSLAAALLPTPIQAAPPPAISTTVVISEFRTRGPQGAGDEFIELFNLTAAPINLAGWQIQGSNHQGKTFDCLTVGPDTTIPAYGHFLATGPAYSGSIAGDQSYTAVIPDNGGIALIRANGTAVDQAGMHRRAYHEGAALTKLPSDMNRSYERRPGGRQGNSQDTGDNLADFVMRVASDPQRLDSPWTPPSAGLVIRKTSPSVVEAGYPITYTITLANTGTQAATSTVVTDVLPAEVSFDSYIPASYPLAWPAPGTLEWEVGTVPTGAPERTITVFGTVAGGLAVGTPFTNTALCSTATLEDTLADNVSRRRIWVGKAPDLNLSQSAPDWVDIGAPILFTIHYENTGNLVADNLVLTSHLPAGLVFATASAGGQLEGNDVIWHLPDLPAGGSGSVTLTTTASARGTYTSQAEIRSNPIDVDPDNNTASSQVMVLAPDLSTSGKQVSLSTCRPDELLIYTIVLTNTGDGDATVVVTDVLPSQVTLVDPGPLTDLGSGVLGWSGLVATDTPIELPFTVRVDPLPENAGSIVFKNTATIDDGFHPSFGVSSPDTAVNVSSGVVEHKVYFSTLLSSTTPR